MVQDLSSPADLGGCAVVELRRYLLHPGQFDRLQRVFQRELVVPQLEAGMRLGGQFRDRDAPDRFVWFRGFASMEQRHRALESFYRGPVWRAHAAEANATMIDSDDVLLLRSTAPPHPPGPAVDPVVDPVTGEEWAVLQVLTLPDAPDPGRRTAWIASTYHAALERAVGTRVAMWRTEHSPNTFAALPVRTGHFVVSLAVLPTAGAWRAAAARLTDDADLRRCEEILAAGGVTVEWTHLAPTASSRHPAPAG